MILHGETGGTLLGKYFRLYFALYLGPSLYHKLK